ncbi:magnesium transporter CorA family protein [Solidesulfovibrio sp.]
MLQCFIGDAGKPRIVDGMPRRCWIHMVDPSEEELASIAGDLGVPMDFLTDPLDVDERSRIEQDSGVLLLVVRVPVRNDGADSVPFSTVAQGIILAGDHVLTVSKVENELTRHFVEGLAKQCSPDRPGRFVIQLLQRNALQFLADLREINRLTNGIEQELHKSSRNEELIRLVNIEKSLVYFITSLKSNDLIMKTLLRRKIIVLDEDDRDLLEDALIENKQAISMTKIYTDILSGLMDAFASIISNNLNVTMKFLTSFTIILMIPNILAGLYGMNVKLPLQDDPEAFGYVVLASFGFAVALITVFVKKRWF